MNAMAQTEIWKEYKRFNHNTIITNIEISNFGNIRGDLWNYKPLNESCFKIKKGRRFIGGMPIYHLVWMSFNGPVPKGYVLHHIDGNKLNDRLDNLMLMTDEDHSRHHNTNPSKEKRNKMSIARKGKHYPKLSDALRKRKASDETKLKMSKSRINRCWFNNGVEEMLCYECPEGFNKGRLPRKPEWNIKTSNTFKLKKLRYSL